MWRGNEEEEVPFLYTVPIAKGPDKGPEGDSIGHFAAEAQRARAVSFKSGEWRSRSWTGVSYLPHTPASAPAERDLRTAPRTHPLGKRCQQL